MRTLSLVLGLILAPTLAGCGIAATVRAREDMEQSKSAYKQCLGQHSQDPSQCTALRQAFEADMAAYRATSSHGAVVDIHESK